MFAGDWPVCYALNLHSRIATRVLLRRREGLHEGGRHLPAGAGNGVAAMVPADTDAARRHHGDQVAAEEPRFRHAARQDGICDRFRRDCNDVRPSIDTPRRMSASRPSSPTAARCTSTPRRPALAARPAPEIGGSAAQGKSCRRHPAPDRLAAGHPAVRPDVRQRYLPARSRPDRPRHRPGQPPQFAFERLRASIRSPGAACARRRWRRKPAAWADIFGADPLAAIGARRNRQPRSGLLDAVELISPTSSRLPRRPITASPSATRPTACACEEQGIAGRLLSRNWPAH